MNKDEYLARAAADDSWAPGWEAIDEAFAVVYPGVEPAHYVTDLTRRAMMGGDAYLDGYSLFPSPKGFQHVVTYGMSELYADGERFGLEYSRWGYEMTAKVRAEEPQECMWVIDSMSNLARYTYTREKWFEPFHYVSGGGVPLQEGSALTSFVIVEDTEVRGRDTMHGRLEFLQLVGITQKELDWVAGEGGGPDRARELVGRMKTDSPLLVTDLARTNEYV